MGKSPGELNALAVDVVGARLLGFEPQGVRHLWEAGLLGLGEIDTANMRFPKIGLSRAFEIFTEKAHGTDRQLKKLYKPENKH